MRKSISFLLCLLMSSVCLFAAKDKREIRVKVQVESVPQFGATISRGNEQTTFTFQEGKEAEWKLQNKDAVFFYLQNGFSERQYFYAEAGDELTFAYDGVSMRKTLRVTGKQRPAIFRYLANRKLKRVKNEQFKLNVADFVTFLGEFEKENLALLESCQQELEAESQLFVRLERERIHLDACLYLLDYSAMYPRMTQQKGKPLPEAYYEALKSMVRNDESLLNLTEYTDLVRGAAKIMAMKEGKVSEYQRLLKQVAHLNDLCTNRAIKEEMIQKLVCDYVSYNGIKGVDELDALYRKCVKTKERRKQYQTLYNGWANLEPGHKAIDFKATDVNGKTYSLKDFKGKNVYVYLWQDVFPCIREFECLKKMKPALEEKNIEVVALFIGNDREKWAGMLQNENMDAAVQLFVGFDSDFLNSWHFDTYGMFQFIWIDAKGKIIRSHAPKASSGEWNL